MRTLNSRVMKSIGAVACAIGTLGALAAPLPAIAEEPNKTTEVTIEASRANLDFEVPTIIPFGVDATGTLITPESEDLKIENHSVFAIHVTNMSVAQQSPWMLVTDATTAGNDNSIDFQVGPQDSMQDAFAASKVGGIDTSGDASWDMDYQGSGSDFIQLECAGNVANVSADIQHGQSKVAAITWTIEAGQHGE